MKPVLLILKTGSAPDPIRRQHGDFDRWFIQGLGPDRFDFRILAVDEGDRLPADATGFSGVLVTGSPAMVSHREDWSEMAAGWLREAHQEKVPMLGVCYGHQLLAHALGGQVGSNPAGRRMGTTPVEVIDPADPLLGGFEPGVRFHVTHMEAVLEPPSGARVIARADGDRHHGLHFGANSWGVQFHPEFDAEIMACYIQLRSDALKQEGIDPDKLLAAVQAAPAGTDLLRRFASRVCESRI